MARVAAGPSSEERRQQIIAAARCVFARKGFMGATNKDIALAAGVTPGLLYHYFADKRALFEAVWMEHSPLGDVSALLVDEGVQQLAPRELLLTLIRVMVTRTEAAENVGAFQCIIGEAMHEPETSALFNAKAARVVETLAGFLRPQMEGRRLRPLDPTLVAQLIIGSVLACVMRRKITRDPALSAYSVEQIATTLTEMVLGGLEVPTTQAARLKPRDYMLASNRSHVWRLCQFVHSFYEPPVSSDQRNAGGHKTAPTVLKEKTHV